MLRWTYRVRRVRDASSSRKKAMTAPTELTEGVAGAEPKFGFETSIVRPSLSVEGMTAGRWRGSHFRPITSSGDRMPHVGRPSAKS